MQFNELMFREVNLVLIHPPLNIGAISFDRIRAARAASNIQISTGNGAVAVIYPDDRMVAQFEAQRLTVTDNSTRSPETSLVVETAMAQLVALNHPPALAFGFNIRFDFELQGVDTPGVELMQGLIRDPPRLAEALRTDIFQTGVALVYRRGVKLWTLRIDPVMGFPRRLAVHANIHEDLQPPPMVAPPGGVAPPPPPWLEGPPAEIGAPSLPNLESMRGDLAVQSRTTLDTVAQVLTLGLSSRDSA